MLKIYAKKFVKLSKTDDVVKMSNYEKNEFVKLIFKKIPNITKDELIGICNSPAKINEILYKGVR